MLHEAAARRQHPRIALLTDGANEVLHHVEERLHHDEHHRILGRSRENAMEIEMDRRLIIKIDFVAPRAFGRRDIRIERLDILGSRALACDAHRDRFNQHTRLGQMLGRNRAEMEHVAQAGDDGVAGALAHEGAAAGALLQAQQAGVFQRPQRLAQGVARYSELLGQQALGGQSIAGPQAPVGQLDPNLLGDFFECARSPDRAGIRSGHPRALRRELYRDAPRQPARRPGA